MHLKTFTSVHNFFVNLKIYNLVVFYLTRLESLSLRLQNRFVTSLEVITIY